VSSTLTRELVDDDTLQLVRTAPVCASTSYASARGGAVLCRFAGKAGIIVLSLIEMKAFRQILRVTWTVKRTKDWVLSKAGTEPFLLQSVKKRELSLLWSCATERRKLHGERNNARYYFWSKKKRKTKNTLAG